MARPISQNNNAAVKIITEQMTAHPTTTRKHMVEVLADQLLLSPSAAGYYVDRACRPLFKSLQQMQLPEQQ